jgi:hypothetical protein
MRNLRPRAILLAAAAIVGVACSDDPVDPIITPGAADITLDITANRTLYAETTYTLKGFIHVTNGATLTIQPGTKIQGDFNTLGSSLFVLRGARIVAVGTAANPIVFTSSRPAQSRQPGDWGGLVIIGNGVVNRTGQIKLEGTGTGSAGVSGSNYAVNYTGDNPSPSNNDNSGELRYVRVEYAGFGPVNAEELNSFTFAAVGNQTKLSYLQTMAGLDDAFEWFGGNVDADHLVAYEAGDDAFDMSEGYQGRLQFLIAYNSTVLTQRSGAGLPATDPQGIENDGCNGSGCTSSFNTQPYTTPVVANFTLVGTGSTTTSGSSGGIGMMLRRGTGGYYVNGIIAKFPRAGISVRDADTYARAGSTPTPALTADLAVKNILMVETPTAFDPQVVGSSTIQNSFDLAGNAIVNNTTATTASLFTAFPTTAPDANTTAAAFDWSLSATSAAASGGLTTFSGNLTTKTATASATGNTITGTSYVGAAPPGNKWWAGWTVYAQK